MAELRMDFEEFFDGVIVFKGGEIVVRGRVSIA